MNVKKSVATKDGSEAAHTTFSIDIVPDRRIVYSYNMTVGSEPLSASLSTVEFLGEDAGTRLVFTEQDAFSDAMDSVKSRENATRALPDKLATSLA